MDARRKRAEHEEWSNEAFGANVAGRSSQASIMMARFRRVSRSGGAMLAFALATARVARADDAPSEPKSAVEPSAGRRALSAGAAIVPGLLVHGSGHFVAGDTRTGYRLLALEGIGLGTLALGFVPIVATGASRRIVGPAAALSVAGAGLFVISALADLYGVLAPVGGVGASSGEAPVFGAEAGYRYVYDPVFARRHFAFYALDYRPGAWRLHPSAWFGLEGTTSRLRFPVAFRFAGPKPSPAPRSVDGSYLDVEAAVTRHAEIEDRFITTTVEVSVEGRVDMQRVAPSLAGSFAELGVGWAVQRYGYQVKGVPADVGDLLLARFGYGMYVGFPGASRGEVMLYYDHRHDDFAAGLKIPGIPSGVAGHFGIEGRMFVSDHMGVSAEAAVGSAYVVGASLLFRQGDRL
jgi:hypothetical protein